MLWNGDYGKPFAILATHSCPSDENLNTERCSMAINAEQQTCFPFLGTFVIRNILPNSFTYLFKFGLDAKLCWNSYDDNGIP